MSKLQGFASLTPEQRREIAKKGGLKVSQNKDHMSRIGRLGGMKSKPPKKD